MPPDYYHKMTEISVNIILHFIYVLLKKAPSQTQQKYI